jgi:hypothetical protein
LSVSTIAITSSSFTESPISLDHDSSTAVVIESPKDSNGSVIRLAGAEKNKEWRIRMENEE